MHSKKRTKLEQAGGTDSKSPVQAHIIAPHDCRCNLRELLLINVPQVNFMQRLNLSAVELKIQSQLDQPLLK